MAARTQSVSGGVGGSVGKAVSVKQSDLDALRAELSQPAPHHRHGPRGWEPSEEVAELVRVGRAHGHSYRAIWRRLHEAGLVNICYDTLKGWCHNHGEVE